MDSGRRGLPNDISLMSQFERECYGSQRRRGEQLKSNWWIPIKTIVMPKRPSNGSLKPGQKTNSAKGSIFKSTMKGLPKSLLKKSLKKDLTIFAGNGAKVRCHKTIFLAHSPALAAFMSPENENAMKLDMQEYSETAVNLLIRFAYGLKITIEGHLTCAEAVEFCVMAHRYGLSDLRKNMGIRICQTTNSEWYNPDEILKLYFIVENVDSLEGFDLLVVMLRMEDSIRSCGKYKALNPTVADELRKKLLHVNALFGSGF